MFRFTALIFAEIVGKLSPHVAIPTLIAGGSGSQLYVLYSSRNLLVLGLLAVYIR